MIYIHYKEQDLLPRMPEYIRKQWYSEVNVLYDMNVEVKASSNIALS